MIARRSATLYRQHTARQLVFQSVQTLEMGMQASSRENWLKVEGASEAAVDNLRVAAGFELPNSYVELLRYSNGGEGPMSAYGQFCLDRAEDAAKQVKLHPGWFVFGGNGGLELFAFDVTGAAPWPVLAFDGVDPVGSACRVTDDFDAFIELVGS